MPEPTVARYRLPRYPPGTVEVCHEEGVVSQYETGSVTRLPNALARLSTFPSRTILPGLPC